MIPENYKWLQTVDNDSGVSPLNPEVNKDFRVSKNTPDCEQ
jgi:hypothetical protein